MEIHEQLQRSPGNACTLERELGGGGMSQVFPAEETAPGRVDPIPLFNRRPDELYEAKGDRVKGVEHHRQVVGLWKNADPERKVVVRKLRHRVRRLSDTERVSR